MSTSPKLQKTGIANGYDYANLQNDNSFVKFYSSATAIPVSVYKETPLLLLQFLQKILFLVILRSSHL